jgi:hypothetical protein
MWMPLHKDPETTCEHAKPLYLYIDAGTWNPKRK